LIRIPGQPSDLPGKGEDMSPAVNDANGVLRAGSNQLELLEFLIEKPDGKEEKYQGIYGINVSKVMEVIRMTSLTEVPKAPPYVLGIMELRGRTIPIISLAKWMGISEGKRDAGKDKIIVTEFNNTSFGFVVHQANRIRRIPWDQVQLPPDMINDELGGNITGTVLIGNNRLLLLIDLEKIVDVLSPNKGNAFTPPEGPVEPGERTKKILVVDDSAVARKQIRSILSKGNYDIDLVTDGRQAWQRLEQYYKMAREKGVSIREMVHLVLTDVEMPEMDGYTLTREIKNDKRFKTLPVIMHSSMSGESNITKGNEAGCDIYVVKFDPELLFKTVSSF
jgi:two-component system chemotaxis response regulator CheV